MRLLKSELVQIYESHLKRSERSVLLEAYWGKRDMVDFHDARYEGYFTADQLELGATVTVGGGPISSPPELLLDGGPKDDVENAIRIHGWLKGLSRAEANDPRLWVTLTHREFFEYVRERWSITRDTSPGSILSRFFFSGVGIQARTRNAISRLWWLAELTYEPGAKDPYGLLKLTLRHQDMQLNLYERRFGMVESLRRLIPRFFSDADGNKRLTSHYDFRYTYIGLTAWSASTPLAMLSDPEKCWELLCQIEDLHFRQNPSLEKRVKPRCEFPADVFELSGIGQSAVGSSMIVEEGAESIPELSDEVVTTPAEIEGEIVEEEVETQEVAEELVAFGPEWKTYLKRVINQDKQRTPSVSIQAATKFFGCPDELDASFEVSVSAADGEVDVRIECRRTRHEFRMFPESIVSDFDEGDLLRFDKAEDGHFKMYVIRQSDSEDSVEFDLLGEENHLLLEEELNVPHSPSESASPDQFEQRSCVLFMCELKPDVRERFDGAKSMVGWCFEEDWERTVGQDKPFSDRLGKLDGRWRDVIYKILTRQNGESPRKVSFMDRRAKAAEMAMSKTRLGRRTISFVEVMEGGEKENETSPDPMVIFLCSTKSNVKRRERVNLVIRQCPLPKWKELEGFHEIGYRGQTLLNKLKDSRINDHLQRVMFDENMREVGAGEDADERMEAWKVELASARRRAMLESEFRELMGLKADA